jgi:hypothetical protein
MAPEILGLVDRLRYLEMGQDEEPTLQPNTDSENPRQANTYSENPRQAWIGGAPSDLGRPQMEARATGNALAAMQPQ